MRLQDMVRGYIDTLLWAESIEGMGQVSEETREAITVICVQYVNMLDKHNIILVPTYTECPRYEYIGGKLYLQQAGHGTGLWDMDVDYEHTSESQREHAVKLADSLPRIEFYESDDVIYHMG